MDYSKIPVRYSKALFLAAREAKVEKKVVNDLKFIQSYLSVKGFKEFLESPVIKTSAKKGFVREAFGEQIHPLSLNFFDLVLTNKREIYFESIIRDYVYLYREANGIKNASLKTTFRISGDLRGKFISLLEKTFHSTIEMEEIIEPGLIGGFVLKVEDEQYDASIKTSLSRVKKELLETI